MPSLQTATKEHMKLGGTILLHLCIGDICTRVWFDTVPHLAVNTLEGRPFNDLLVHKIFLAERKVVPWRSPPVAILTHNQQKEKKQYSQDVNYTNPNNDNFNDAKQLSCV